MCSPFIRKEANRYYWLVKGQLIPKHTKEEKQKFSMSQKVIQWVQYKKVLLSWVTAHMKEKEKNKFSVSQEIMLPSQVITNLSF